LYTISVPISEAVIELKLANVLRTISNGLVHVKKEYVIGSKHLWTERNVRYTVKPTVIAIAPRNPPIVTDGWVAPSATRSTYTHNVAEIVPSTQWIRYAAGIICYAVINLHYASFLR
jgi:hypothetical protein